MEFFAKSKETIIQFIWKGKKPKIAYNKLVQNIASGGLGLCDLKAKDVALKINWIKKSYVQESAPFWVKAAGVTL